MASVSAASPVRFPPVDMIKDADLGAPSRRPLSSRHAAGADMAMSAPADMAMSPLGHNGRNAHPAEHGLPVHQNMVFAPTAPYADEELQTLRDEVDVLRSHADGILHENERLHEELRRHAEIIAEARASGLAPGQGGYHPSNAPVSVEEWEELQERLEIAQQENDALLEQQHRADGEIARLRESHRSAVREAFERGTEAATARDEGSLWRRQSDEQASQLRAMEEDRERLEQELRQRRMDADALEEELRRCRMEVQQSASAQSAVKQKLLAANSEVQSQARALEEKDRRLRASEDQMRTFEQSIMEARSETDGLRRTSSEAQKERDALRDALAAAKRSIDLAQQREMGMYNHVQECMDLIEESNLERDQALLREQQATKELARLADRMRMSLKEAEDRSRAEIDAARQIAATECKKLRDELARAEESDAAARAQVERALRDKRTAEHELERVMKEQPTELARMDGLVENLNRRLRAAEAERDKMVTELEALRSTAQQQLQHTENERARLAGQLEDTTRRLRTTERLIEDARVERLEALRQVEEMRKVVAEANAAREDAESRFTARVEALARRHEAAIRDAEVRINEVASRGDAEAAELREMVTQSQQAAAGWREQARSGRAVVSELQRELDRALRELDDMKGQIEATNEARLRLKGEVDEQARLLRRADVAVAEASAQAEAAAHWAEAQVARMDAQHREEKRQIRRDLRIARVERDRIARERDTISARVLRLPAGDPTDLFLADYPEDYPADAHLSSLRGVRADNAAAGGEFEDLFLASHAGAKNDTRLSSSRPPRRHRTERETIVHSPEERSALRVESRGTGYAGEDDPSSEAGSGEPVRGGGEVSAAVLHASAHRGTRRQEESDDEDDDSASER